MDLFVHLLSEIVFSWWYIYVNLTVLLVKMTFSFKFNFLSQYFLVVIPFSQWYLTWLWKFWILNVCTRRMPQIYQWHYDCLKVELADIALSAGNAFVVLWLALAILTGNGLLCAASLKSSTLGGSSYPTEQRMAIWADSQCHMSMIIPVIIRIL